MNRNFYAKRVRITKNNKVIRRASNIAHTTSTDSTVTKQRRKKHTTLSKDAARKIVRIMSRSR